MTTSQLDITKESQEISFFPAGDHKASIHRRARKHHKNKTEITLMLHKKSTALERSVKNILLECLHCKLVSRRANLTLSSDVDSCTCSAVYMHKGVTLSSVSTVAVGRNVKPQTKHKTFFILDISIESLDEKLYIILEWSRRTHQQYQPLSRRLWHHASHQCFTECKSGISWPISQKNVV